MSSISVNHAAAAVMMSDGIRDSSVKGEHIPDDLSRDVYCILGITVDAIGMRSCLHRIEATTASRMPFLISTPNLNFLVISQSDPAFRESLLRSDLCPADGMPIVWIARLLGIPIKNRVAGSDIFDALRSEYDAEKPLKVFLFGGAEGIAASACRALNASQGGLYCVGSLYPGFGSVDEFSRDDIIDKINASAADFLVASLGAYKGQLWLERNHHRFLIPIRAHLGASINFQAGTVARSPTFMRKLGMEWLWRIKEEPYLWRRYWNDWRVLLRLLFARVLPLVILNLWQELRCGRQRSDLVVNQTHNGNSITVSLRGFAARKNVDKIIAVLREAAASQKRVTIDLTSTSGVDQRVLGLMLMLRKQLTNRGTRLTFEGVSPALKRAFRLNGVEFLLSPEKQVD
jgi:N-acetylglucosaminyldiphosphoundecaprenol N-acetyl-beta-D-mannosaminyltransferase